MSDEQLEIQLRAFDRKKEMTREEAISHLVSIGVMNKDGLHRDLNYGGDSPILDYSLYDITPILDSLSLK